MLLSRHPDRAGELLTTKSKELADRARVPQSKLQQPDPTELHGEGEVVRDAVLIMPVLVHAAGRPNDEAQKHVRHAARDAAWIRRERRHDVLARAEGVVLVPVLDVREACNVEKPRVERDSPVERRAFDCIGPRGTRPREEQRAEVVLHGVPVELDIVVAVDERERVPIRHEAGERVEHVAMALDDQPQLDANVVDCVAEAVLALLVAGLGRQVRSVGAHRHPDEVDEVACDDQAPAVARKATAR